MKKLLLLSVFVCSLLSCQKKYVYYMPSNSYVSDKFVGKIYYRISGSSDTIWFDGFRDSEGFVFASSESGCVMDDSYTVFVGMSGSKERSYSSSSLIDGKDHLLKVNDTAFIHFSLIKFQVPNRPRYGCVY